jgi:twitching motility protein PilT
VDEDRPNGGFEPNGDARDMKIDDLLRFMVKQEASDLHLKPMRPPLVRISGKLLPLKTDVLHPDLLRDMLNALLSDKLRATLEEKNSVDFGYSVAGVSRFRASVFYQRGSLAAVFRRVPFDFPALEDWGMPAILSEFAKTGQGLVVITGPTGSGKSSTLAALMRLIATTRLVHIITIEDPIEFLLKDGLGAITQREVGTDTPGFAEALKNAMRQDPDVIMVGEMRDLTTVQTVLTAAETGHLVFSTLHTNSAAQTVDRIIDMFPEGNHRQIRQQLATVLQAVVSLQLVEKADGSGLVAAVEILRTSPRVAKLIAEGALESLEEEIELSVAYHYMQSMNQSLAALVLNGVITRETALDASNRSGDLDLLLRKSIAAVNQTAVPEEGDTMAEALNDFSKIRELQEIKRLYDELQERVGGDIGEKDAEIERLRAEIAAQAPAAMGNDAEIDRLRGENERLQRQVNLVRQEYEAKIAGLNARIRELSATPTPMPAAGGPEGKGGFFRR